MEITVCGRRGFVLPPVNPDPVGTFPTRGFHGYVSHARRYRNQNCPAIVWTGYENTTPVALSALKPIKQIRITPIPRLTTAPKMFEGIDGSQT